MFTGIVRELGEIEGLERSEAGARLRVGSGLAAELATGESVAVNGVCLTATALDQEGFEADVMNRTLELTTLGSLGVGDRVNLEPALRAGDPLGGHIVQGHVDTTAEVRAVTDDGFARRVEVALPAGLERYVVERGSIAIEGVSLTVAALDREAVTVSLIPETLERTTLGSLSTADRVNVELDQIARYVERLIPFAKQNR